MSVIGSNALAGASGQGGGGGFVIEKSLRFTKGDSAYLSRTFSGTPNKKKFTFSVWFKGAVQNSHQYLLQTQHVSSNYFEFTLNNYRLQAYNAVPGINVNLERQLRDPSAWYHAVLVVDTTQAVEADRLKIYLNGEHQTDYLSGASTFPAQNAEFELPNRDWYIANAYFNSTSQSTNFFDGYMAEFHYVDGEAKDVTDFGAFDDNGVWQAAKYSGSHGTNGFHLDFADGSNIGNDAAGSNNWTANNLNGVAASVLVSDVTIQSGGSIISGGDPGNWFDGNKDTYAYANLSDSTNYIQWAPSGGYTTPGYIWIQGGDGNGDGLDVMTVTINGSTVSHSSVVSNETYSQAAYDWGKWYKYAVSGNTLNSVRVTGAFTLLRQISTVADPTHSVLGISDDNDVPVLIAGSPADLDLLFDSPTNGDATADTGAGGEVSGNYCTMNPLANYLTLANGNLDVSQSSTAHHTSFATMGVASGKWYWEVTKNDGTSSSSTSIGLGVAKISFTSDGSTYISSTDTVLGYMQSGVGLYDGDGYSRLVTALGSGVEHTAGTWMLAFDFDAGKGWIGKDGTWLSDTTAGNEGNPATGANPSFNGFVSGETYVPMVGMYAATSVSANFGQRSWKYAAPSGFKALCTTNLPTPDVSDGSAYFDAKLYDGNGSTNAITGLDFSPDLVWLKSRGQAKSHCLFDTVRGVNKRLLAQTTDEEYTVANTLTSFDNNGFTLGSNNEANNSGYSHVAWAWDAGDSTVSNTDGSITSSVRANPSAGFSIVSYTGSSSAVTVGHGLNAAPKMIIVKDLDNTYNWQVNHISLGADESLILNGNNAATDYNAWNNTRPTSSVFSLGAGISGVNTNGADLIALVFAPVAGYSAFGSYVGDNNAGGAFVYTGFRPRFILLKDIDNSAYIWNIFDSERDAYNVSDTPLEASTSASETSTTYPGAIDIMSNGFKIRSTHSNSYINTSGNTVIYAAFAEHPFQANGGLAR